MIISPKIRGFICTTAHPQGCAQHVAEQIRYIKQQTPLREGPKKVLVIGASTEVHGGAGVIATAGGIDTHIHFICPQQIDHALSKVGI